MSYGYWAFNVEIYDAPSYNISRLGNLLYSGIVPLIYYNDNLVALSDLYGNKETILSDVMTVAPGFTELSYAANSSGAYLNTAKTLLPSITNEVVSTTGYTSIVNRLTGKIVTVSTSSGNNNISIANIDKNNNITNLRIIQGQYIVPLLNCGNIDSNGIELYALGISSSDISNIYTANSFYVGINLRNANNGSRYIKAYSARTPLEEFLGSNPTPVEIPTDPYAPGSESGTGGGGGSFDNTSTPIDIPNLPSISAASTGFISLYNPSLNQLNQLASYLWSDLFEINGWKKLFADPMDAILGLSIVPVAVPSGGIREVKVGNIGTGISLTVASTQFVEVDCGSINVNEYWGAYLDYEPYTQAQIFLPYIGTRPISVDEIMGKTVHVVYHVDILTGACCCFVKCGDSVLYTYNGQCSIPIPITGANYTSVVNGVISVAASVGSLVATGGSSAPTAIPAIASSAVNQMKPQVEKSGSISGSAGVLNMQTPYLILIRPRQALPSKQNEFIGYPSLITVQLTELSGYTEVQSIHLENIPATQEELAEIESLLEGGVIF